MSRVDEINEQIRKLEEEREEAIRQQRAAVLTKMRSDIKLYGFKTTDFKGVLKTRKRRSKSNEETAESE